SLSHLPMIRSRRFRFASPNNVCRASRCSSSTFALRAGHSNAVAKMPYFGSMPLASVSSALKARSDALTSLRQVSRNVIRLPIGNRNGHYNYNMKIILIGADLCARPCFLSQPFRVINIIEHMFCLLTKLLHLLAQNRPPFTLSLTGALLAPIQTFLTFSP